MLTQCRVYSCAVARSSGSSWLLWLVIFLLSGPSVSPDAHALAFDLEAAYTDDDNVTRAQLDSDILDDTLLSVTVGASFLKWLGKTKRLIIRGFVHADSYDTYDGLSNVALGGQLTYQYRRSGAFTTPTFGVFAKAAVADFDSELRDSDFLSLGASWRKPFTDRITYTAQLTWNKRESDGTVFDTEEISLLQNVDYTLGRRWTLYLTYNYLDGDIVSTATPTLQIVNAADAIDADDAFGGAAANKFAYRLEAKTDVFTLGVNLKISDKHSLDLSGRWIDSDAKSGGISYERRLLSLAYLTRF